ncbi:MAG: glycosyltransferase family 4 protein [Candidatus Bathyarchaeia archaeon]
MKIAFCLHISLTYGGGGEKWTINVANALEKRNHKIEIRALPYTPHKRKVLKTQDVLNENILYTESWHHGLDADVAYVFYNPLSNIFFKMKCPRVAGIHSQVYFLSKTPPITYGIPAIISRSLYKAIGRVDLSSFDGIHIVNEFPVYHNNVFYIPNFVNAEIYHPVKPKSDKFTALFIGRPTWQKGWDTFFEAASILKRKHKDIEFKVAGFDHKKTGKIRYLGYISDENELAKIYSSAHVALLPSRADTFGVTILESLACGTPVVTTPSSPHKNLRLPLFYAETADEFAKAIEQLRSLWIKNPGAYQKISEEAKNAAKKYDMQVILPKIEEMFVKVSKSQM